MKRCPECRRDYYDDTLLYCLEDGNALLQGSVPSPDEPATAILSEFGVPPSGGSGSEPGAVATGFRTDEAQTRPHVLTTDQTAILRTGAEAEPRESLGGSSEKHSFSANRAAKPLIAVIAVLIVAGIGFGIYKFATGKQSGPAPSFESMKITRLTDTGRAGYAAISPDGKYVLHVREDAGQESLWVGQIATGSNVQVVPPAWGDFGGMTFTPDGDYVFFIGREKSKGNNQLFQIPVLGGEPKKLLADVHSPVTFSPDGKRIAFVRFSRGSGSTVMLANADGSGEQTLATMPRPDSFTSSGPAWSPDGKVIATAAFDTVGSESFMNIVEIRVEDGSIKPVGSQKWSDVSRVAWLADGSGIITTCGEKGSNTSQVYEISYPGGEPRKITNDLNYYSEASLTGDSGSMVTVQRERTLNIWTAPDGDIGRARQLTHGSNKGDGDGGLKWTPDGKIVYTSRASGNYNVWIMNGDGSSPRQLTRTVSMSPAVSSDGRYVVFSAPSKDEKIDIWRMDIDGSNQKQLTNSGGVGPEVSPDGSWVIYSTIVSGVPNLWKVSIDGGESVQLTDYISLQASISPDGKSIACYYREQTGSPMRLAIIPFEGGQPTKVLDFPPDFSMGRDSHWLPDGRSIAYVVDRDGVSNIWSMPIDGGAPKQLTKFTADQISNFDLSRDGKPNLFSRGATTRDVVLISGFRK